jgi:hypothetical protein
MFAIPRRPVAPLVLAAAVVLGACRGADGSALDQDSALARDLARAGVDSTAQPQLQDVPPGKEEPTLTIAPPRSRPRAAAPRPKTTPPPPAVVPAPAAEPPAAAPPPTTTVTRSEPGSERPLGAIAAGATFTLTSTSKVCTNTSKVGERFTATLRDAVSGSSGAVIPAGSPVTIEITQLHRSENTNDKIVMGFRVVSVTVGDKTYYPDADIVSAEITRVRATSTSSDAKKVLGGAVAGAIIGQIIGRDRKGTLIGAAAGAAAGGAAAAATADYDGCVNAGAAVVVKLNAPLTIAAGA